MNPKSFYFGIFVGCLCVLGSSLAIDDKKISFRVMLREGNKDLEWDNSLADNHSSEYRELANKVRAKIGILFLNITGVHDIIINAFRPGSVYTDLTISLKNNSNTSRDAFMTVVNKTDWVDLTAGTPSRSFLVGLIFVNGTMISNIAFESDQVESILFSLFKEIPGFQDATVLDVTNLDSNHVPMEIRLLFDSRSRVNEDKLKNIILSYKGGINGTVRFTQVTIKEERPISPPKPSKPTWLVIIVALSCLTITAGLIAFVYRVFKQSFLKAPKFKLNEDDENRRRPRSRTSTETSPASAEPHQNCVASPDGAL